MHLSVSYERDSHTKMVEQTEESVTSVDSGEPKEPCIEWGHDYSNRIGNFESADGHARLARSQHILNLIHQWREWRSLDPLATSLL